MDHGGKVLLVQTLEGDCTKWCLTEDSGTYTGTDSYSNANALLPSMLFLTATSNGDHPLVLSSYHLMVEGTTQAQQWYHITVSDDCYDHTH
jgi:hypothetical protein